MNKHGITKENLVETLPLALRNDPSVVALAEALADVLVARLPEIDRLLIYPAIDTLDEPLLDILAYDYKVDWWDPEYTLEEKRRTLKDSWRVHKLLGTKAAVERAIRAIYPETTVEPWFDYEGEPYHFRLRINITSDSGDKERQRRVLERLNYYKSLRDTVDAVKYFLKPEKTWAVVGGGFAGSRREFYTSLSPPPLVKPGGRCTINAGGQLGGLYRRMDASLAIPPLARPRGKATTAAGGAVWGSAQRTSVAAVTVPPLERPRGMAGTMAGTVVWGSLRRVSAVVRPGGPLTVPSGRGGAGCGAGMAHTYQRTWVSVGSPEINL